jgi:hypothetical protein
VSPRGVRCWGLDRPEGVRGREVCLALRRSSVAFMRASRASSSEV